MVWKSSPFIEKIIALGFRWCLYLTLAQLGLCWRRMRCLAGHKGSQVNLGLFLPPGVTNRCPTTSCVLWGGKMLPFCSATPCLYGVCIPTILLRPYRQPAASSGNTPWPNPPPSPPHNNSRSCQMEALIGYLGVHKWAHLAPSRYLYLSIFRCCLAGVVDCWCVFWPVCIFSLVARELSSSAIASTAADLMG